MTVQHRRRPIHRHMTRPIPLPVCGNCGSSHGKRRADGSVMIHASKRAVILTSEGAELPCEFCTAGIVRLPVRPNEDAAHTNLTAPANAA